MHTAIQKSTFAQAISVPGGAALNITDTFDSTVRDGHAILSPTDNNILEAQVSFQLGPSGSDRETANMLEVCFHTTSATIYSASMCYDKEELFTKKSLHKNRPFKLQLIQTACPMLLDNEISVVLGIRFDDITSKLELDSVNVEFLGAAYRYPGAVGCAIVYCLSETGVAR
ncbi:hypothetical protein BDD12DRAFT_804920 [Trichophaea hybrida]|nr:hypothetical protein BDD12DRAFT_804920 [Trichophaea hybrida]